jgi:hypothetical protein
MGLDDGESGKASGGFDYRTAEYVWQRFTGTRLMESERENSN